MRKAFAFLLMALGAILLVGSPVAFTLLAMFGCGMNTTGCSEFHFPWAEAVQWLTLPLLIGALFAFLGYRLLRPRQD